MKDLENLKDIIDIVDNLEIQKTELEAEIERLKHAQRLELQNIEFEYKEQILNLKLQVKKMKLENVDHKFNNMVDFLKRNGGCYRVDFHMSQSSVNLYSSLKGVKQNVQDVITERTAKIIITPTSSGFNTLHYEEDI